MSGFSFNPVWILPLTFYCLISCSSEKSPVIDTDLSDIAYLHCKASQLKDARFNLADSIRFLQDSLLNHHQRSNTNVSDWKLELEKMEEMKIILANESRNLGDSIRQVIFRLTHNMSLEEKRIFNEKLKAKTKKLDCY